MPRGRRVNSSGEKSKQLLLEKAMEIFSTYGYHETKISDIVKSANLTQPTFYLYFQSKETLYKDLMELFKSNFFEIVERDLEDNKKISSVYESIHRHIENILKYFSENPYLTKIGFYDSQDAHEVKEVYAQKLVEKFESAQQFNDVNVRILADSIIGAIERVTLTSLFTRRSEPEQLALDLVNIYFANQLIRN